eukprot:TRINITY_DN27471_c0_g1_i1.p1 TRINITY_DN27471_c0_g1~~TRINITY_DN27471_c0_g1_i1.p1  ORF type:complete len:873 (+),score=120.08 TRINITY_DN27471_c0_g1_i1:100-2718(+)
MAVVAQPVQGMPVAAEVQNGALPVAQPVFPPVAQPVGQTGTAHAIVAPPVAYPCSAMDPPPLPPSCAPPGGKPPDHYPVAAPPVGVADHPYQSVDCPVAPVVGVPVHPMTAGPKPVEVHCVQLVGGQTMEGPEPPGVLQSLRVHIEVHVATAFVTVSGLFRVGGSPAARSARLLCVPMGEDGTVTGAWARCESVGRPPVIVQSVVVGRTDVSKVTVRSGMEGVAGAPDELAKVGNFLPSVFRLPIEMLAGGDLVRFHCTYMQPLEFTPFDARYSISVPLRPPLEHLPDGVINLGQICEISLHIHAGSAEVQWGDTSFPTSATAADCAEGFVALASMRDRWWDPKRDFRASYRVVAKEVICSVLVQDPGLVAAAAKRDPYAVSVPDWGEEGDMAYFAVLLAPPAPQFRTASCFSRDVFFLLDQSYSMEGAPLDAAKEAVKEALQTLLPGDRFGIAAFNHLAPHMRIQDGSAPRALYCGGSLVELTSQTADDAVRWVSNVEINGGTNIMDQVVYAFGRLQPESEAYEEPSPAPFLSGYHEMSQPQKAPVDRLPFVFLITDGCVSNERDICNWVQGQRRESGPRHKHSRVRVCTFGIGPSCNLSFLRQLAKVGRGYSGSSLTLHSVQHKIKRLVEQASQPLITDLALTTEFGQLPDCELYPHPFPDLFGGQPAIVSGMCSRATLPDVLHITGQAPRGQAWSVRRELKPTAIPLSLVFAKERLDLLIADEWLKPGMFGRDRIVDASCGYGIPCAHTLRRGAGPPERGGGALVQAEREAAAAEGRRRAHAEYQDRGGGGGRRGAPRGGYHGLWGPFGSGGRCRGDVQRLPEPKFWQLEQWRWRLACSGSGPGSRRGPGGLRVLRTDVRMRGVRQLQL